MASDVVGPPLAAPAPAPAPACDVVAADDDVARFKGGIGNGDLACGLFLIRSFALASVSASI